MARWAIAMRVVTIGPRWSRTVQGLVRDPIRTWEADARTDGRGTTAWPVGLSPSGMMRFSTHG